LQVGPRSLRVELCLCRAADFANVLTNVERRIRDAEKTRDEGVEQPRNRRTDRCEFQRDAQRAKLLKGRRQFAGGWRQQLGRQIIVRKKLAPQVGFEPTTLRLTADLVVAASRCKHKYLDARDLGYLPSWGDSGGIQYVKRGDLRPDLHTPIGQQKNRWRHFILGGPQLRAAGRKIAW